MALNPSVAFAGRITAPDANYPYGSSKNETSAGAGDGTQYVKIRADDIFGFQQALLSAAAIVPSGNSDNALISQYLDAMKFIISKNTWVNTINYAIGSIVTGSDNLLYRAAIVSGPATAPVNPVGDGSGTWLAFFDSVGKVAQIVQMQTGALASGSTACIDDDSIPQNTEGNEFLTLAITPKDVANRLLIMCDYQIGNNATSVIISALYQDTTANALAASTTYSASTTRIQPMALVHDMVAGTIASTTFKLRVGAAGAVSIDLNGLAGGRKNGGVMASGIKIIEYTP